MGYGKKDNGKTDTYSPDDTDSVMYVEHYVSLTELIERVNKKWPGVCADEVRIIPQRIQTTYPEYSTDTTEYTNFLRIAKLA
jgi:phage tail protein X